MVLKIVLGLFLKNAPVTIEEVNKKYYYYKLGSDL